MSSVYVVLRKTDAKGMEDYEPMAAFSSYEDANRQARILRVIYDVEVHELELDQTILEPVGTVVVSNGE